MDASVSQQDLIWLERLPFYSNQVLLTCDSIVISYFGMGVIVEFYAIIIIVECGSAGQVLHLDGWTLATRGRGAICARKATVLSGILSLRRN